MQTDRRPLGQRDADSKVERWLLGVDGHTVAWRMEKKRREESNIKGKKTMKRNPLYSQCVQIESEPFGLGVHT